MMTPSCKRQND